MWRRVFFVNISVEPTTSICKSEDGGSQILRKVRARHETARRHIPENAILILLRKLILGFSTLQHSYILVLFAILCYFKVH
jgi:rhodanese-related sulfurtransferase